MSQSGYMTFLHKSTRQTLDIAGDNSLISNIRKTVFSRMRVSVLRKQHMKSEKTGAARDNTAVSALPVFTKTKRGNKHASVRQMADPQRGSAERDRSEAQLHQNKHCLITKLRNAHANTKPNTEAQETIKLCF